MKAVAAIIATMGIALSATFAGAAEQGAVYQWVDKEGTPVYQDRPPEGPEGANGATELNLRYKLTDGQAVAAASKSKAEVAETAKLRETQQAEDKDAEKADREKVASERAEGCTKARERMQKYETAHRLYKPGPDGQRNYLSDEEIDSARAEARRTVDEWCGE